MRWRVDAGHGRAAIAIDFCCAKADMLDLGVVDPLGRRLHRPLHNGGTGRGEVRLWRRQRDGWRLTTHLEGRWAGCEYGASSR